MLTWIQERTLQSLCPASAEALSRDIASSHGAAECAGSSTSSAPSWPRCACSSGQLGASMLQSSRHFATMSTDFLRIMHHVSILISTFLNQIFKQNSSDFEKSDVLIATFKRILKTFCILDYLNKQKTDFNKNIMFNNLRLEIQFAKA